MDITLRYAAMRRLLMESQTIAVVGHSDKPERDSYRIAQFLRDEGYTVFPVNPTLNTIDGEPSYPSLQDVPEPIDIVNIFRRSEYVPDIVQESIAVGAKSIWMQLGVISEIGREVAIDAGIAVVMNRCIKVEYRQVGLTAAMRG